MSGLYIRTISIYRPTPALGSDQQMQVGLVDYAGLSTANEVLRFENVPASIQGKSLGNTRNSDIPAGSPGPTKWIVFVPRGALSIGDVDDQDIVVDDLGERYQVAAAYFNRLGYRLETIRTAHAEA